MSVIVIRADEGAAQSELEELDDRGRFQVLAVLQWLHAKGRLEASCALERESGVTYSEGALPVAAVLETCLDMFGSYRNGAAGSTKPVVSIVEEELLSLERGACCTGPLAESVAASPDGLPANITAVCWVSRSFDEYFSLAASADRRLRLFGPAGGAALAEFSDFGSPLLALDACERGAGFEVIATAMGGEVAVLRLTQETDGRVGDEFAPEPRGAAARACRAAGAWAFQLVQRLQDHSKHVTCARFSPAGGACEGGSSCAAGSCFLSISRDHSARLYSRGASGEFIAKGVIRLTSEVTACCWLSPETFVLAAREHHNLLYWDVQGAADGGLKERCKTNLNALGDTFVSFAVLALAVSPNGKMIAACTDKSRVIVLEAFTSRQLRNLYGAIAEEYDTPSVCFSVDGTFLYVTSTLPAVPSKALEDDDRLANAKVMCGQICVFELSNGEQVLQLQCHERPVRCMARHPHTEALVTGSFDRTVRYWG